MHFFKFVHLMHLLYVFANCTPPIYYTFTQCILCTFNFSWVLQWSLEKLKTIPMQLFWGEGEGGTNKVYCGRYFHKWWMYGDCCICFKVLINTWLILNMSPIFFYVSDWCPHGHQHSINISLWQYSWNAFVFFDQRCPRGKM